MDARWPQDGPKRAPRWPQEGPRWSQDFPKRPKMVPRCGPRAKMLIFLKFFLMFFFFKKKNGHFGKYSNKPSRAAGNVDFL